MKSLGKYTYPFFESIRIEDRHPQLLDLHQQRVNHVFKYYFPNRQPLHLESCIEKNPNPSFGLTKCRIKYNAKEFYIEYIEYTQRVVQKLVLLESDLSYPFKFTNRIAWDEQTQMLEEEKEALLITKGRIRETTYGNIAVRLGGEWYTPQYPVFYGVMRRHLLDENHLVEKDLFIADLIDCDEMRIINALIPLQHSNSIREWEFWTSE